MKTLICTDGSDQAENAIRFGGLIASACQAETTLLGITEDEGDKDEIFDSLKRGQQALKDLKVKAEATSKVGAPLKEIVKRTEDADYDLVVIGATRKGARGPFLRSAKANRIVKEVEAPVLVVLGKRKDLKRILICSGDQTRFDKAVEFTATIAKAAGASVTLFHVLIEPPLLYADLIRMEEDVDLLLESNSTLANKLKDEKKILDKMEVDNQIRLSHGHITNKIIKEVRGEDYDLVVGGSSRHSGKLQSYFIGNITRQILNRADRPVLVVRTDEGFAVGRRLNKSSRRLAKRLQKARKVPIRNQIESPAMSKHSPEPGGSANL